MSNRDRRNLTILGLCLLALVLILGLGACSPPDLPVCHYVHSEGVHVTMATSDLVLLEADFVVEGMAVDWWDQCGAVIELEGNVQGYDAKVKVEFPGCPK